MTPSPPDPADALAGSLLGLALGDALGFVVEGEPPEVAGDYVNGWLRSGRAGRRGHARFPFGQYSDDTQLARELLLSLAEDGDWHPPRFGRRVAALVFEGRDVGAGPGTRAAALRLLLGAPWEHAGVPPPYCGNGSAMRVAPVGTLLGGEEPAWRRCAREQSRVTHQDPRCAAGAVAIAGAAALAAAGRATPREFVQQVAEWAAAEEPSVGDSIRMLEQWLGLPPPAAARRLGEAGLDPGHARGWRGISSSVVPSVVWSLYAFLRSPDDWWEAVCVAIEVGGDTDTLAAMTGAIAGARHGPAVLPVSLLERLTDRGRWGAGELADLAATCARMSARSRVSRIGPGDVIVAKAEPTIQP